MAVALSDSTSTVLLAGMASESMWRTWRFRCTLLLLSTILEYVTGAQTLHPDQAIWGHFVVACREPGCESVFYDPPHEP